RLLRFKRSCDHGGRQDCFALCAPVITAAGKIAPLLHFTLFCVSFAFKRTCDHGGRQDCYALCAPVITAAKTVPLRSTLFCAVFKLLRRLRIFSVYLCTFGY